MTKRLGSLIIVMFVAFSLVMTGCKKDPGTPPTDVLNAARQALMASDLERCAPEEFARAQELLAQAEEAVEDEDYDRAEQLADEALAMAREARRVAQANPDCQPEPVEEEPVVEEEVEEPPYEFTTVYFDFDSSRLRDEAQRELRQHADELEENESIRIRIEGHCSEEGTNEYNLALGERRARSVRDYLVRLGVDESRLSTISYGEERPVGRGSVNRRCEFDVR